MQPSVLEFREVKVLIQVARYSNIQTNTHEIEPRKIRDGVETFVLPTAQLFRGINVMSLLVLDP